ncbi:hypothetical protein [Parvularcula sp. LCG005]|uniref:hypothetical protein n=1 Tax=Parvularcula sp. LCG005 TaxID=3078805 RepID=UPI00294375B6|nr:hypothetical protein [Parvularcula sp. LCG005]WOI52832.1 hypothetical protein RUI03_11815 [Parvularcula sp. LCG005]
MKARHVTGTMTALILMVLMATTAQAQTPQSESHPTSVCSSLQARGVDCYFNDADMDYYSPGDPADEMHVYFAPPFPYAAQSVFYRAADKTFWLYLEGEDYPILLGPPLGPELSSRMGSVTKMYFGQTRDGELLHGAFIPYETDLRAERGSDAAAIGATILGGVLLWALLSGDDDAQTTTAEAGAPGNACRRQIEAGYFKCDAAIVFNSCNTVGCSYEWDCAAERLVTKGSGRKKSQMIERGGRYGKCRVSRFAPSNNSSYVCDPTTGTDANSVDQLVAKLCR